VFPALNWCRVLMSVRAKLSAPFEVIRIRFEGRRSASSPADWKTMLSNHDLKRFATDSQACWKSTVMNWPPGWRRPRQEGGLHPDCQALVPEHCW
jgi:hypothetical protein